MRNPVALGLGLLFVCAVPAFSQAARPAAPAKKPSAASAQGKSTAKHLTLEQVGKLISVGLPDKAISQEILSHGITGDFDRKGVERLKAQGAGPETVAALTRLLPKCALILQTSSDADILIDGVPRGKTPDTGQLAIDDLDPGRHELRIVKLHHKLFSRELILAANQPTTVRAPLEWAVGFITVDPKVPGAEITIEGAGQFRNRLDRFAVETGPHAISVLAPFRKPFSAKVTVDGGQSLTVPVRLEVDEAAVEALGRQVVAAHASAQYARAVESGRAYLELSGTDKEALRALALSFLVIGHYADFASTAVRALSAGADLQFSLVHHHTNWGVIGTRVAHYCDVSLSATEFRYAPNARCNFKAVSIPIRQASFSLTRLPEGRAFSVSFANPDNPKKTSTMNFLARDDNLLESLLTVGQAAAKGELTAPR